MANSITQKKYTQSQKVKDAFDNYTNHKLNNKPSDYSFSGSELLNQTQDKYFNKENFSYDVSTDPLYTQYKEMYQTQGKKAMEDSVGNAISQTGGYGNSYAQTVGMSTYNDYMGELSNIIPELYSAAYSRYESELENLESKLGYLLDKDKSEYSKYLDSYKFYEDESDDLLKLYLSEYENDIDIQNSDWESAYKLAMAEQERELANAELGYKYHVSNLNNEQFNKELDLKKQQADDKNAQYWNDFNYTTRETLREDEIYALMSDGNLYDALRALDHKYVDNEVARYKALLMGFDKDYVDAYFSAQKKGGSK